MQPVDDANQYAALFRQNIVRNVRATLRRMPLGDALLSADEKAQALNALEFGLEQADAWPHVRDLLLHIAPKMEQAGHREPWLGLLERGVTQSVTMHDEQAQGELSLHVGYLHLLLSRFEQADQWFTNGLLCFERIDDASGQGRALNRRAMAALRQRRFGEAVALVGEALNLLEPGEVDVANSYFVLGAVAESKQEWVEAEQYYRHSLEIWEVVGDQRRVAWGLRNLGPALRRQARLEEAADCYQQALKIFEQIYDPINQAITQMNLGIVYSNKQQPELALKSYEHAKIIFERYSDRLNLAKIYTNMGIDYRLLSQYELAENTLLQAVSAWEELQNVRSFCNALVELGLTYTALGQYEQANQIFRRALERLLQIQDDPSYASLKAVITESLKSSDEGGECQE